MIFEQTDVAVAKLRHRPGGLGRAAARLGQEQINIDYSYCGLVPDSKLALHNLSRAAAVLDELAKEDGAENGLYTAAGFEAGRRPSQE
jgi:hypothetical protein